MTASDDFTSVTEKSIVYRLRRGGVPVVALFMLNLSFFNVSAKPIDGGYVSSLFLIWRPAGYLTLPT